MLMSTLLALLALLFLLTGAVGLLSFVIYPFKFLGIRTRGRGFALLLCSVVAAGFVGNQLAQSNGTTAKNEAANGAATLVAKTGSTADDSAPAQASLPEDERAFIKAIDHARGAYASGANDMVKGASRPARARQLCALGLNARVNNWIGKITTLSSNSDGKGVLSIEIAPDISMKTWNNDLSDFQDHTLIDPQSSFFDLISQMKTGQLVRFSGTLVRATPDCFREASMTMQGSMTEPEFILRFEDAKAL